MEFSQKLILIAPEILLFCGAVVVAVLGLSNARAIRRAVPFVTALFLVGAVVGTVYVYRNEDALQASGLLFPRLGLFINATGGFGDVGFCGYWTLQMFAVQPLRIYPGVPICQIFYHEIVGEFLEYSSDKYQHNRDVQPSLFFKELNPEIEDDTQMELQFGLERSHS